MQISDNLDPRAVVELDARTAEDAIAALVEAAHRIYGLREPVAQLVAGVQARERAGSTCLGGGVAIPHEKFANLEREVVLVGRSKAGIDFNAADGLPVQMLFLLLGPKNVKKHLEVLAALARICRRADFLQTSLGFETSADLYEWLVAIEV